MFFKLRDVSWVQAALVSNNSGLQLRMTKLKLKQIPLYTVTVPISQLQEAVIVGLVLFFLTLMSQHIWNQNQTSFHS